MAGVVDAGLVGYWKTGFISPTAVERDMEYSIHIEMKTNGGTSATILMFGDSIRLLDLFAEAIRDIGSAFDNVEKGDAVREAKAIVFDVRWRELMGK